MLIWQIDDGILCAIYFYCTAFFDCLVCVMNADGKHTRITRKKCRAKKFRVGFDFGNFKVNARTCSTHGRPARNKIKNCERKLNGENISCGTINLLYSILQHCFRFVSKKFAFRSAFSLNRVLIAFIKV